MTLNVNIHQYAKKVDDLGGASSWPGLPEFPAALELFDSGRKAHEEELELDSNIVVGRHSSKMDYLSRHYGLLREDAVAPLRDAVDELQTYPYITETESQNDAYIYEKVSLKF